jgi:hypothetical protein
MACAAYIYDKKSWSKDNPFNLYMVCAIYIFNKKIWSRDTPCILYMACTAYIYEKNIVPETSPTTSIWLVQPIYMMKKLVQRHPVEPVKGMYILYI